MYEQLLYLRITSILNIYANQSIIFYLNVNALSEILIRISNCQIRAFLNRITVQMIDLF